VEGPVPLTGNRSEDLLAAADTSAEGDQDTQDTKLREHLIRLGKETMAEKVSLPYILIFLSGYAPD
jgi:hypothetical protein